jgi:hypothetical protein
MANPTEQKCECTECHVCRGHGTLWFALGSKVGTVHRTDDMGEPETCENCRGTGLEDGPCYFCQMAQEDEEYQA